VDESGDEAPPTTGTAALPPRSRRIGELLTLLATTARSFLLYDAKNDAIRRFLVSLVDGFATALREEKTINVEVRAFEIVFDGRPVYLNRDRERSLAFRLYRDGVRALSFHEGFDAEEVARLLEILSIRYTGVHQHEDDTVTLLWKAGFQFLDVVAVEGLVPETGEAETPSAAQRSEPAAFLSEDVDLPLPPSPTPSTPTWVEVSGGTRQMLADQASAAGFPEQGLRLLELLGHALDDAGEQMRFAEALPVFEEMRDFLFSAENLVPLLGYVHLLRRLVRAPAPSWDAGRQEAVVRLLLSCGTERALRKLIHTIPGGERVMRPELVEFFDLVCADPFAAAAEALAAENNPAGRAVARQLLEHYGKRRGLLLRQRFAEARGQVAADLLRSLVRLDGEAPAAFLARQCAHPDGEVREEALWHLERMAYTGALGHPLLDAFRRTEGDHRRRILALIEGSQDRRFVEPLAALLEGESLEPERALEIGGVLGRLEGPPALERWKTWLVPQGRFLRKHLTGSLEQQVVAAAAVAEIPGAAATEVLEAAHSVATAEAQAWIASLLAKRPAPQERQLA
jgi:hypothetical protein